MRAPAHESRHFPMGEREFVALMAMIQALQALAIDVMLPALGDIAHDLNVADPNRRQLVIGLFLVCSGAASLFPGILADRFGRRGIVLIALVGYSLLSFACAFVSDFETMLVLRMLIGVFSSALMIMPITIIRDRFSGDLMARTQSLVAMVFMIVPMLAPLLGQGIMLVADWRWIFGAMGGIGVMVGVWTWFRLPETLHPEYRQTMRPRQIAANMRAAVTHRAAIGYFVGAALVQGALFGYINSAQQLVGEALGAGAWFPLIFGAMALLMAMTNFVNSRLVMRFGTRRVSHAAVIAYLVTAAIHFAIALSGETLWQFVPLMSMAMCFMSFIGANFQAIALQPFARIAGAAASVMSFIRVVAGATLGILIGQAFDGTARPLVGAMLLTSAGALLFVLYSERGRLFRRLHYPDNESKRL